MQQEIIQHIEKNFSLETKEKISKEMLIEKLTNYINNLINTDFSKLVFLLYKIDINENKLKAILENTNADSAQTIAHLIIEREIEKYNSRKENSQKNTNSEEEKW